MINGPKNFSLLVACIFTACSHADSKSTTHPIALENSESGNGISLVTAGNADNILPATDQLGRTFFTSQRASQRLIRMKNKTYISDSIKTELNAYMGRVSADGDQIVYVSTDLDAKGDIFLDSTSITNLSKPLRITDDKTEDFDPDISNDAQRIVFARKKFRKDPEIILYLPKEEKTINTSIFGVQPRFSSNGKKIVYQNRNDIFLYDIETRKNRSITSGIALDSFPVFSDDNSIHLFSQKE